MRLFAVILALLLAGCVNPAVKEFDDWAALNRAKAERGEIKWSEHYLEEYNRLAAMPTVPGKADSMHWAATLIAASAMYETGALSKEDFETVQRNARVAAERRIEAAASDRARAMAGALQSISKDVYGPEATRARQIPITPLPPTINCRTVGANTRCTQY